MISKEVFFSLDQAQQRGQQFIDDSYVDNIDTKDLVDLGQSLQGVAAGRITFLTVPDHRIHGRMAATSICARRTPGRSSTRSSTTTRCPRRSNADNTPVPGTPESMTNQTSESPTSEAPAPEGTAPADELVDAVTTDPAAVTVQVSNSTGQDGLGATAATELQAHGFNVTTPDDYPRVR